MHTDVVILGGGLAGLTLALQLRARLPSLAITVLERDTHPVPEAAHKVGESTVEIGANYLDTVLGLGAHLRERQLRKFGFRFFFNDGTARGRRGQRARRQPLPANAGLPARSRHPGKLSGRARSRRNPAIHHWCHRAPGAAGRRRHAHGGLSKWRHRARAHRGLGGRRQRTRRHPAPPARTADRQWPPCERRLVPARHSHRHRRLVAGHRLARALQLP